jgi:hypothetical protein
LLWKNGALERFEGATGETDVDEGRQMVRRKRRKSLVREE